MSRRLRHYFPWLFAATLPVSLFANCLCAAASLPSLSFTSPARSRCTAFIFPYPDRRTTTATAALDPALDPAARAASLALPPPAGVSVLLRLRCTGGGEEEAEGAVATLAAAAAALLLVTGDTGGICNPVTGLAVVFFVSDQPCMICSVLVLVLLATAGTVC